MYQICDHMGKIENVDHLNVDHFPGQLTLYLRHKDKKKKIGRGYELYWKIFVIQMTIRYNIWTLLEFRIEQNNF